MAGCVYFNTRDTESLLKVIKPGKQLDWDKVRQGAASYLGLSEQQAIRLFHVKNWPTQFAVQYHLAKNGLERVEALRRAVEDFVATDGWAPVVHLSLQGDQLVERTI